MAATASSASAHMPTNVSTARARVRDAHRDALRAHSAAALHTTSAIATMRPHTPTAIVTVSATLCAHMSSNRSHGTPHTTARTLTAWNANTHATTTPASNSVPLTHMIVSSSRCVRDIVALDRVALLRAFTRGDNLGSPSAPGSSVSRLRSSCTHFSRSASSALPSVAHLCQCTPLIGGARARTLSPAMP
jgi:hypothetical protein